MSIIEGYRDSESLTKWVRYMLYIQILVGVAAIFSGCLEYQLLSDYQNGVYTSQESAIADGEANTNRQSIIGGLDILVFVIAGFLILKWIHRANYNIRQLGAENLKFTSGWAIGYYFIPILSLWKPYQAMAEIWKASKNPLDWETEKVSDILPIWWVVWLLAGFYSQYALRLSMKAEELSELMNLNLIMLTSDTLGVQLSLILLVVVNRVHKMQSNWAHNANTQIHSSVISVG